MQIKVFEPDDVFLSDKWNIEFTPKLVDVLANNPSVTVSTNEGEVVCVIGGEKISPDVAVVHLIGTSVFAQKPLGAIKEIKQAMDFYSSYHNLRKIYTTAVEETRRWVEWMGFHLEYIMRDAIAEDQHLYGYTMIMKNHEKEVA